MHQKDDYFNYIWFTEFKNMKRIFTLIITAVLIMLSNSNLSAQEKAKTEITSVKQKDQTIRFTLTSSKPQIFADNRYVL